MITSITLGTGGLFLGRSNPLKQPVLAGFTVIANLSVLRCSPVYKT
jgi:hypothetical protein